MNEIGVLFVYHKLDEVTQNNFDCLRYYNPSTVIIPIYSGTQADRDRHGLLPDSFEMSRQNVIAEKWEEYRNDSKKAWHNNDLALYAWALERQRALQINRDIGTPQTIMKPMSWCIIDYDTLCTLPIRDAFTRVADCNAVAASVMFPSRDTGWFTPHDLDGLGDLVPYLMGCVPLCGAMVSDKGLSAIVKKYLEHPLDAFCELRLGTLANACGFPFVANPHASGTLAWNEQAFVDPKVPAIWHPVKRVIGWK